MSRYLSPKPGVRTSSENRALLRRTPQGTSRAEGILLGIMLLFVFVVGINWFARIARPIINAVF